ncbi:MAG TPA: glutathione S-transferase family protein [Rhodanobacteraceae bacterium]|nr:glutathione S-transferase family protein [Rhodanobacteraceae bacterium]
MKLYWSDVLSPRKACAVARHLDSQVEYIYVDFTKGEHRSADYLAMNPNGKVPTLVDGTRVLWEADAIMCHLAARCDSDLWPQDARQIDVIRWLSWAAQHFNRHAGTLFFEHIIRPRFSLGETDPRVVAQADGEFRRFAAILDAHLERRRWLVADTLTIADFSVAVTLPDAERARIPLADFPAIHRWHQRLNELDAWRQPFPRHEPALSG